jgi:hypothetical protein
VTGILLALGWDDPFVEVDQLDKPGARPVVQLAQVVEGRADEAELPEGLQQLRRVLQDGPGILRVQDELVIGHGSLLPAPLIRGAGENKTLHIRSATTTPSRSPRWHDPDSLC